MKANIHPKTHDDAIILCSCGNKFTAISTKDHITVEVCSKCHPFYTGETRFIDARGHVERFIKKQEFAKAFKEKHGDKKDKKENKTGKQGKTLRELLGEV